MAPPASIAAGWRDPTGLAEGLAALAPNFRVTRRLRVLEVSVDLSFAFAPFDRLNARET
jgi:hypothetical protein